MLTVFIFNDGIIGNLHLIVHIHICYKHLKK